MMDAYAGLADIIGTVISVICAHHVIRFVVGKTHAEPVTGIRVRTVIIGRITAGCASGVVII